MSNFWENGILNLNPDLIPWGTYNVGSSLPDINDWIKSYGPGGTGGTTWEMVMQPALTTPTTTMTLSYNITNSEEDSTCWGTLWFAFVPYNVGTSAVQGGNNRANSRIYLLQIDSATSNNQSGWYYMDQMSEVPIFIDSVSVPDPPSSTETTNLWVYFDYENKRAYAGMGGSQAAAVGENSIDKGKGVALSDLLQASDTNWGYLLAFAKLDVGDITSSFGGIGPVRIWTDDMTCCFYGGVTGTPPGSMNCKGFSGGNSSCDNVAGSVNTSPPTGYCGTDGNTTDPICGCLNGDLDNTDLNYCFGFNCLTNSYRSDSVGTVNCTAKCIDIINIAAAGNVALSNVSENCGGFEWIMDNWEVILASGIGVTAIIIVLLLFWTGWL